MASNTASYSFYLPTVGGDTNSWGGYLNSNWDDVDDLLDGTTPVDGVDIDGGTIDGTPIGGTTPAAGAFSTLSVGGAAITATLVGQWSTAYSWGDHASGGYLVAASNLSDLASAATAFANIKQAATTSATGVVELSTAAEFRNDTAGKALTGEAVWDAVETVALIDAASIVFNLDNGVNFSVTLGGNRTLANATGSFRPGQSGHIAVTQDGTGSRTLSFGTDYEFAGGSAPTLSTAAGAKDILFYKVLAANSIFISLAAAVA